MFGDLFCYFHAAAGVNFTPNGNEVKVTTQQTILFTPQLLLRHTSLGGGNFENGSVTA